MSTPKIFESEYKFCLILWKNEPIHSGELVRICGRELGWKPTTTYTVIKRLSERGVIKNESSVVTSIVKKEEAQKSEINELVDRIFGGSLPSFISAFADSRNLTDEEIGEIQDMIDRYRKDERK